MHLEGSFTVRAPRERVWLFFIDPYALASCIDDPHDIEVINDDYFKGWVRSGVAFMKGTFTGWARITEKNPPERGHVKAHGGGMGSGFDAEYKPIAANVEKYKTSYARYSKLAELIEGGFNEL